MGDVTLQQVHKSSTSTEEADFGNVFTFEVTVDLPHITDATDIKMEIFAIEPISGIGGFFICDPRVKSAGDGINVADGTNKTDPPRTLEQNPDYPSVVCIFFKAWGTNHVDKRGERGGCSDDHNT